MDSRHLNQPHAVVMILGLLWLCLCLAMQMLGVPATLWDTHDGGDTFGASVLEGFSLPTALQPPPTPFLSSSVAISSVHHVSAVPIHQLFQPPRFSR